MPTGPLLSKRLQNIFSTIQEITTEILLQKINNKSSCYIIDVREEAEWYQGAIPEAIHIPRGYLELHIEQIAPDPNAEIILYCGGGTRSALAAENLQNMGYQNVKSLKGGFRSWVAVGLLTTSSRT